MASHKVRVCFEVSAFITASSMHVDVKDVMNQVENNIINVVEAAINNRAHVGIQDLPVVFKTLTGGYVETSYSVVDKPLLRLIEGPIK